MHPEKVHLLTDIVQNSEDDGLLNRIDLNVSLKCRICQEARRVKALNTPQVSWRSERHTESSFRSA